MVSMIHYIAMISMETGSQVKDFCDINNFNNIAHLDKIQTNYRGSHIDNINSTFKQTPHKVSLW